MPMLSSAKRESLERLVTKCEANIETAREYLAGRGISLAQAQAYRLGVIGADAPRSLQYLRGRLAIPYLDRVGPAYVRYRCLGNHDCKIMEHPKYDGPAIEKPPLFNATAFFKKSPYLAVVEGEIDTIVMDGPVGVPAVGLPGSEYWRVGRRDHADFRVGLFENYETVFVIGDGDPAGDKMARLVGEDLYTAGVNMQIVRWDRGEDVNSIYLREGREGVLERLGLINGGTEEEG